MPLLMSACTTELHRDLDERSANEMLVLLSANSLSAEKVPAAEGGKWDVRVAKREHDDALAITTRSGLPRPKNSARDIITQSQGLVPSPEQERLRNSALVAASLEETLLSMDGVLDARVHLVLPAPAENRVGPQETEKSRGSVVIVARSADSSPAADAIRAVVMGAVQGIEANDISVVASISPLPDAEPSRFVRVGPFSVESGSAFGLRAALAGLTTLLIATALALAFVAHRMLGQTRK